MALEVNIRKKLGSFTLDVAFSAKAEWMGILGASGCGKSMTLKCIAGIETPDAGYIRYNGRTLFDSAQKINLPPRLRRVGYLFQSYALFPHMTVLKNIMIGIPRSETNPMSVAEQAMERLCLQGLASKRPDQLSGGQQQRVALARLLASQPDMILLDEPFSALDSHLKWKLEQELTQAMSSFRGTLLMVSHNRDELYRMCETLCVFDNGHIDAAGGMHDVFKNPGTVQAALLSGCKNICRAEILSSRTLRAADWDMVLELPRPIPPDTRYVGIRRHDVRLHSALGTHANTAPVHVIGEVDNMFSYVATVSAQNAASGEAGQIECETGKEGWLKLREKPLFVELPKEYLLLLR
ncbi:MAG TPA: ATP-binding cassette domain-containing protein [Candidatus Limiplasma sp.]|nr:ATP-binding cassette domain-containing protein [Candidatus Limiplasma sp.]HRX07848.1 ATP-binding cassette domain-containing protein [Candidatus Limiplasma sp.]